MNASIERSSTAMNLPKGMGRRPKRCSCGVCGQCQEDARWERIFQEKFADPDYYSNNLPRRVSSLSGFGGARTRN